MKEVLNMHHKIGRVCVNPPGPDKGPSRGREFIEVDVGLSGNLRGHRLEHLANPNTSDQHWLSFFDFPASATHKPGETVRVYEGNGSDGPDSKGTYCYYAAGPSGSGRPWLNNTGDTVRLVESGREIDRRVLQGNECEETPGNPGRGKPGRLVTPPRTFGG